MSEINLNNAPYHDRFDSEKNRNKVLFRPDRPLQQSELNELQSIAEHNLRQLGDSIFEDGALQSGMAFSIDEVNGTLTVEDGLVYVEGKVRQFKEQTIQFAGEGIEKIGVKVEKRIVDHNEDPTLLDQTQGVDSHLSEGADRLEETVVLTYNDESAPTIYRFEDGQLFIDPNRPEFSLINEVLAQRTYEESGSYQVEGFDMWTEESEEEDKIALIVDRGIGYVLGHRISKPTSTRVPVNKSREFRQVIRETHTYDTSIRKNKVGSSSVKEITRLLARTESPAGGVTISKGGEDGRDPIPAEYTSIIRDSTVLWTNSPEVMYTYGTDYTIVEENGVQYVNWNTGMNGKEPDVGTSYFMTFDYDRQLKKDVDYLVEMVPWENGRGWDTYIDFNGTTGIKPKNQGIISLDYDFYLARVDVITLDKFGNFSVLEGQPDTVNMVKVPEHTDPTTLQIGTVFVFPNSSTAHTENNGVVRLHMKDLQRMKKRLENVEYNQAIQQLEHGTLISEDPLVLRGIFSDAFTDFTGMDANLSSISFSFDDASITLPVVSRDDQKRRPNLNLTESVASTWGRLVSAPFKEIPEIVQPLATEAWNVNPYAVYNKLGVLDLEPAADNWIEEERITLHEEDHITTRINRWWRHQRPGDPLGELSEFNQYLVDNTMLHDGIVWGGPGGRVSESNPTGIGAEIEGTMINTARETWDEVIEFIRQREVEFTAENMLPLSDNLTLTFDGIRVPLEPTGNTVKGSTDGTLRSDSNGRVTGKFFIPAGIRTGVREVTLQNPDNMATATYTAQGTRKVIEDTITTTRVTFNLYDPLAQSFAFPSDRVVTSFDLYFGSKSTRDNVIVQVRGLSEGGYPNRTVYAERILTPNDINISEDASVPTNVKLDDPLLVKAGQGYCIAIITDSTDYTMWVGTLGESLLNNPEEVAGSQPYVNGVLFSSSNAVTWTAHQKSDLKFTVYTAEFQEQAVMEFDPMEDLDSDMILLMASYLTPGNTGCFWEIKVVPEKDVGTVSLDSVPWRPLVNYTEQVTGEVIGLAKLRATFESNRYISPMLALDDLMFVNFISATEGDYVTKNINTSEAPYNTIKLSYDVFTPAGTSVTPYYSTDRGQTWKEFTSTPEDDRRSAEYSRLTFTERVSTGAVNENLKIKLTLKAETRFRRPRVRRLTAVFRDEFEN